MAARPRRLDEALRGADAVEALILRLVPVRAVYYAFAAPGTLVHELSHLGACYLTGAKPERVRLLTGTTSPETWTHAMQTLPPVLVDRSAWQALAWPRVLEAMPLWTRLGLSRRDGA